MRNTRSNAWFQILVAPNTLGHGRVGLVVGKKVHKRAVRRNYIKRVVRETFRTGPAAQVPCDFVVRAKQPFTRAEHADVVRGLNVLFAKLSPCRVSSSR